MIVNANGKSAKDGVNGVNGKDGADGLTPFIGPNGNWWIGETDTGVAASSSSGGVTAEVHYLTYDVDSGNWETGEYDTDGIAYHDGTGYIDSDIDAVFVDLYDGAYVYEQQEAWACIEAIWFTGQLSRGTRIYCLHEPAVSFQMKIVVFRGAVTS